MDDMDNLDPQNLDHLLLLRAVGNMAKTTTNFILFGAVVGIVVGIIRGSLIDVLIFGPSVASMFGAIGLIYGIIVQGRLLREERNTRTDRQIVKLVMWSRKKLGFSDVCLAFYGGVFYFKAGDSRWWGDHPEQMIGILIGGWGGWGGGTNLPIEETLLWRVAGCGDNDDI